MLWMKFQLYPKKSSWLVRISLKAENAALLLQLVMRQVTASKHVPVRQVTITTAQKRLALIRVILEDNNLPLY